MKMNLLEAKRIILEHENKITKNKIIGKKYYLHKIIDDIKNQTEPEKENFFLLCTSIDNKVLYLDSLADYDWSEEKKLVREIMTIALSYPTHNITLFHNHPKYVSEPTRNDVYLYYNLQPVLSCIEINFVDSYVIGADGVTSVRSKNRVIDFSYKKKRKK